MLAQAGIQRPESPDAGHKRAGMTLVRVYARKPIQTFIGRQERTMTKAKKPGYL